MCHEAKVCASLLCVKSLLNPVQCDFFPPEGNERKWNINYFITFFFYHETLHDHESNCTQIIKEE